MARQLLLDLRRLPWLARPGIRRGAYHLLARALLLLETPSSPAALVAQTYRAGTTSNCWKLFVRDFSYYLKRRSSTQRTARRHPSATRAGPTPLLFNLK